MAPMLASALTVATLTAVMVIVHMREYVLLIRPTGRSERFVDSPRLTAIVRCEAGYYLVLCGWLAWSWLSGNTIPPNWMILVIVFFSLSHLVGYWHVRTQLVELSAAVSGVDRDSSVAELATMLTTGRNRSYPLTIASIGTFDGFELLMLGWILFYSVSTVRSSL